MERLTLLHTWVCKILKISSVDLEPASSDASFRRYFRFNHDGRSYVLMDAPPSHEDVRPFIKVEEILRGAGMNVPEIYARDVEQGMLLLTDFGGQDYLSTLNNETVETLYDDACQALLTMQSHCSIDVDLPPYDEPLLLREMELFREWFLHKHLGITLSDADEQLISDAFKLLAESALEQTQVCVHRDYHSRNLMVVSQDNPGVLDFQDAVIGSVTYDLVSLLRDCYIRWPQQQVYQWVERYHQQAVEKGITQASQEQFVRWFDLMGVQRHLKAVGIFARLNHRDNKPGYLADIPRTLNYILEVSSRYPELSKFEALIRQQVVVGHDDEGLPRLVESH